jgi:hypothetical protein
VSPACALVLSWATSGIQAEEPGAAVSPSSSAFGPAVDADDLTTYRAGDFDVFNTAVTQQTQTATNQGNTISAGGDVTAGAITVETGALTDLHGMSNVVINSAPQSNLQAQMNLQVILH